MKEALVATNVHPQGGEDRSCRRQGQVGGGCIHHGGYMETKPLSVVRWLRRPTTGKKAVCAPGQPPGQHNISHNTLGWCLEVRMIQGYPILQPCRWFPDTTQHSMSAGMGHRVVLHPAPPRAIASSWGSSGTCHPPQAMAGTLAWAHHRVRGDPRIWGSAVYGLQARVCLAKGHPGRIRLTQESTVTYQPLRASLPRWGSSVRPEARLP